MSLISAETKEDGNNMYEIRGLAVEYFLLPVRKMNLTVVFLEPTLKPSGKAVMTEGTKLMDGIFDVVVGIIPFVPILVSGMTETSIPYISGNAKFFVLCPKQISKGEKFLTVFDASVWLAMIVVFV